MANITISKIKFRRGTENQRQHMVFDQGEPIFTTDTNRVYIGTGTLSGGKVVGSKIHPPLSNYYSLSTVISEIGDIVYANDKYYQLISKDYTNINSWKDVNLKIDDIFFNYNSSNKLSLNSDSISASYLDSSTVADGVYVNSGILKVNFNTKSLEISATQLSLKESGIDEREISSTSISSGLIGGSGEKIQLDVDPTYFIFTDNKLSLSAIPELTFNQINSDWFGDGLIYNTTSEILSSNIASIGNSSLYRNLTGGIAVNPSMFDSGLSYTLSSNIVKLKPNLFSSGMYYNTLTDTVSSNLTDIANTTILRNLTGGISINPDMFGSGLIYNTNTLTISTNLVDIANSTIIKNLSGNISINPTIFGSGMRYNTLTDTLSCNITNIKNITISKDLSGRISVNPIMFGAGFTYDYTSDIVSMENLSGSTDTGWTSLGIDDYGRVTSTSPSIYDILQGDSSLSSYNITNTLSSIFNGSCSISGSPIANITQFTALSSDGITVISLSSAGFITFNNGVPTKSGQSTQRFAIPIFTY